MDPDVLNKQTPLGSVLVRTITQHIRAGKATAVLSDINAGLPLRVQTIRKFQDHAEVIYQNQTYR